MATEKPKYVFHYRTGKNCCRVLSDDELIIPTHHVRPKGGATVVVLPSGHSGFAICSHKDQFNKKLGYRIAYGRALKAKENGHPPINWPEDYMKARQLAKSLTIVRNNELNKKGIGCRFTLFSTKKVDTSQ